MVCQQRGAADVQGIFSVQALCIRYYSNTNLVTGNLRTYINLRLMRRWWPATRSSWRARRWTGQPHPRATCASPPGRRITMHATRHGLHHGRETLPDLHGPSRDMRRTKAHKPLIMP